MLWFLQMPHAAQMPEMNPPRQPTAAMRVPTPYLTAVELSPPPSVPKRG